MWLYWSAAFALIFMNKRVLSIYAILDPNQKKKNTWASKTQNNEKIKVLATSKPIKKPSKNVLVSGGPW